MASLLIRIGLRGTGRLGRATRLVGRTARGSASALAGSSFVPLLFFFAIAHPVLKSTINLFRARCPYDWYYRSRRFGESIVGKLDRTMHLRQADAVGGKKGR